MSLRVGAGIMDIIRFISSIKLTLFMSLGSVRQLHNSCQGRQCSSVQSIVHLMLNNRLPAPAPSVSNFPHPLPGPTPLSPHSPSHTPRSSTFTMLIIPPRPLHRPDPFSNSLLISRRRLILIRLFRVSLSRRDRSGRVMVQNDWVRNIGWRCCCWRKLR